MKPVVLVLVLSWHARRAFAWMLGKLRAAFLFPLEEVAAHDRDLLVSITQHQSSFSFINNKYTTSQFPETRLWACSLLVAKFKLIPRGEGIVRRNNGALTACRKK